MLLPRAVKHPAESDSRSSFALIDQRLSVIPSREGISYFISELVNGIGNCVARNAREAYARDWIIPVLHKLRVWPVGIVLLDFLKKNLRPVRASFLLFQTRYGSSGQQMTFQKQCASGAS